MSGSTDDRPAATGLDDVPRSRDVVAVPLAALLWVVVVLGLGYGVVRTLSQVVALFG